MVYLGTRKQLLKINKQLERKSNRLCIPHDYNLYKSEYSLKECGEIIAGGTMVFSPLRKTIENWLKEKFFKVNLDTYSLVQLCDLDDFRRSILLAKFKNK